MTLFQLNWKSWNRLFVFNINYKSCGKVVVCPEMLYRFRIEKVNVVISLRCLVHLIG